MPIDLTIKVGAARKLLKAISNASVTDKDMSDLYYQIEDGLEHHAAKASQAPWRKVVRYFRQMGDGYEELECGHVRPLKYTARREEARAKKRRCKRCVNEPWGDY